MKPAALSLTLAACAVLAGCGDSSSENGDSPAAQATPAATGTAMSAALGETPAAVTDKAQAQAIADDRHEKFEAIGKAFKGINDQLKAGSPDVAKIRENAATIDGYAKEIPSWFPAGTGPAEGIKTDALATIWAEPARFREAAAGLVTASSRMNAAAQAGDLDAVRAGVKPLGLACKTCHDRFREEDD